MGREISETAKRVYQALVADPPVTTAGLADRLGLTNSTASRHLLGLTREGRARRHRDGNEVLYWPVRDLQARYTGPVSPGSCAPWDHWEWTTDRPIDWRYPLVSRILDDDAQATLIHLLHTSDQLGIFRPWSVMQEAIADWETSASRDDRERLGRQLQDPTWARFEVIVYGSCARGEARSGSDLDILVLGPDPMSREPRLEEIVPRHGPFRERGLTGWHLAVESVVHTVNAHAPRGIDAQYVTATHDGPFRLMESHPETVEIPKALYEEILDEGITVYTSSGSHFSLEARRARRVA